MPVDTHVPGVPVTVQTHAFGEPTAGLWFLTSEPTVHVPVVGAAVA